MTPLAALESAIHGWKKTRHPRFAAIAELATKRALTGERPVVGDSGKAVDVQAWVELFEKRDPLDVPRLFAAAGGGKSSTAAERVTLLSKLKDPRVVSGVLALLEAPPYRAQTALPFFRACTAALVESNDPRVRPALEELSQRYKTILETSVGDLVANILHRAAMSMDQVKPGPLSTEFEDLATNLEAMFEVERARSNGRSAAQKRASSNDDALLEAVYESPDDDAPRLAFADALAERGDIRGEFISLQIRRARGPVSKAQFARERELTRDPKQRMALAMPLARGGKVKFERGFPVALEVDAKTVKFVVGAPALRTLKKISYLQSLSNRLAREVVQHEHARDVFEVGSLKREQFDGLEGALPWRGVSLGFVPSAHDLARLPKLERLSFVASPGDAALRGDLSKLTHLTAKNRWPKDSLPLAMNVRCLKMFVDTDWPAALSGELRALRSLRELEVTYLPAAKAVEGLALERLRGRFVHDVNLGALIDALPKLKHLAVTTDFSSFDMVKKLTAAGAKLSQLETLEFADLHFEKPFTPQATLTLQMPLTMHEYFARLAKVLAALPDGIAPGAVLKHREQHDPSVPFVAPPPAELVRMLQTANPRLPVELDWY